jgi:L-fuconolactonase
MRIDCAAGLCYRSKFTYSWGPSRDYTAEDLAPILARNKFEGAILSALTDDPAETDWLLELAERHSWILGVLTRVPAWQRWQGHRRFLGVESPSVAGAVELAHHGLIATSQPADARKLLEASPSLRLVVRATAGLSFAPESFASWVRTMEPLKETGAIIQMDGLINFVGASGWRAETYRPWVQHLLTTFGPARLMYGSGWPLSMPHATWKESLACFTQAMGAQTMDDRGLILGENAAALVRYTEDSPG